MCTYFGVYTCVFDFTCGVADGDIHLATSLLLHGHAALQLYALVLAWLIGAHHVCVLDATTLCLCICAYSLILFVHLRACALCLSVSLYASTRLMML